MMQEKEVMQLLEETRAAWTFFADQRFAQPNVR